MATRAKQPPNKMVVSDKFYQWLGANGALEVFTSLQALQDRYLQERDTAAHGYRGVSTPKLREVQEKYDNRIARIREELRRRGE